MTDEELIEQVARAICVANGCDPDTMFEGSPIWVDWKDDAQAAIAAMQPRFKAEVDKWREPIIDELMSCHIYRREHEADPRKALHEVITWNCRVALDPAVSAEARALMIRGGEMVKEAAAGTVCGLVAKHATDATIADVADQLGQVLRALSVPAIVEAGDGDL